MASRKNNTDDLGFGTKGTDRSMNKDGSFNVKRLGEPKFRSYEIYHELITMSWPKFILLILLNYTVANLLFAAIYFFIGTEHLSGMDGSTSGAHRFMEAFFFSSQTLTTLGYGRVAPVGAKASSVAAIESMLGLLGFALATGLLYGRFSRPQAKIIFSEHAIIAPYKGGAGLMFRTANMRRNQLIEVEIDVTMAYFEKGANIRSFTALPLERRKINLFPLSWTIVHPIDENSPFFGVSEEELNDMKAELIILMKAFDDTFSQTVYSRSSYKSTEIKYGRKFLPMFFVQENGHTQIDFRLIDAMEAVEVQMKVPARIES
jgi:inward rectifier potassium channel